MLILNEPCAPRIERSPPSFALQLSLSCTTAGCPAIRTPVTDVFLLWPPTNSLIILVRVSVVPWKTLVRVSFTWKAVSFRRVASITNWIAFVLCLHYISYVLWDIHHRSFHYRLGWLWFVYYLLCKAPRFRTGNMRWSNNFAPPCFPICLPRTEYYSIA